MNTQETAKLIALIKRSYPNSFNNLNDQQMAETVFVWADLFEGYPFEVVNSALKEFILTNNTPWAPSPGQLNHVIAKRLKPESERISSFEAWNLVVEQMKSATISRDPQAAFDKLPEIVQKCVGSPSNLRTWSLTNFNDLKFVENGFHKRFRELMEIDENKDALPETVLKRLTGQLSLEG